MEFHLKNQELHEFAQWFSFHYGGGIGGSEEQNKHPREDIIDLVATWTKDNYETTKYNGGHSNVGFVKWFSEKYEIYGDCKGRSYQIFGGEEIINKNAETSQEWIDHHFSNEHLVSGLLYGYFQDKIKGNIFQIHYLQDFKKKLDSDGIKIVDDKGKPLDI